MPAARVPTAVVGFALVACLSACGTRREVTAPDRCGEPADRVVEMETDEVGAPSSLGDLTERSVLVVRGRVASVDEGAVVGAGESRLRQALVSLSVGEIWKGTAGDEVVVALDGWLAGEEGDWREVVLDGQCLPEPDEEYALFLVDAGGRYGATHFLTARSGMLAVIEGFVVANVRRPLARSLHGMSIEELEGAVRAH